MLFIDFPRILQTLFFFLARAFIFGTFGAVYVYTPEAVRSFILINTRNSLSPPHILFEDSLHFFLQHSLIDVYFSFLFVPNHHIYFIIHIHLSPILCIRVPFFLTVPYFYANDCSRSQVWSYLHIILFNWAFSLFSFSFMKHSLWLFHLICRICSSSFGRIGGIVSPYVAQSESLSLFFLLTILFHANSSPFVLFVGLLIHFIRIHGFEMYYLRSSSATGSLHAIIPSLSPWGLWSWWVFVVPLPLYLNILRYIWASIIFFALGFYGFIHFFCIYFWTLMIESRFFQSWFISPIRFFRLVTVCLVSGIAALFLPVETTGLGMADVVEESSVDSLETHGLIQSSERVAKDRFVHENIQAWWTSSP